MALEPITRQEKIIARQDLTPITRLEKFLKNFGGGGGSSVPKPLTYDYMPEGYPKKSVQTVTLMDEQEVAFNTENGTIYINELKNPLEIVVGQTYTVKWDGTEYECVGVAISENVPIIGNLSIMGAGDDTGEPFFCIPSEVGFVTFDTSASHTISVKIIEETITPIDEKYLPTIPVIKFTTRIATNIANDTQPSFTVSNLSYSEICAIFEKGIFQIEDSGSIRYRPINYWIDSSGNINVAIIDIIGPATYALLTCDAGQAMFYRNSWGQLEATQK